MRGSYSSSYTKSHEKSSSICGDYLHIIIFTFSCSSLAYKRNTFTFYYSLSLIHLENVKLAPVGY